ncbi:hypothetical protein ACVW1C_007447 [Bradyrhizobium sp. USDA 4011]
MSGLLSIAMELPALRYGKASDCDAWLAERVRKPRVGNTPLS